MKIVFSHFHNPQVTIYLNNSDEYIQNEDNKKTILPHVMVNKFEIFHSNKDISIFLNF